MISITWTKCSDGLPDDEITVDFDPPLGKSDQPAPYTHAMAAMALQYAREKFAEEMDE